MANSLPYFNFYPADFLLDERVEMMTPAQVGCYILLLSRSWISSEPGYIPTDPERQARLLRLSRQDWDAIKGPVLECFKPDGDRLYQPRLLEEYTKAREAHEARVRGGLSKSGRAEKHHKTKAGNAQHKLSTCSAQAQHKLSTSSAGASLQAQQVVKHVVTDQNRTEQNRSESSSEGVGGNGGGLASDGGDDDDSISSSQPQTRNPGRRADKPDPVVIALEVQLNRQARPHEIMAICDLRQRLEVDPIMCEGQPLTADQTLLDAVEVLPVDTINVKQYLLRVLDTARREKRRPNANTRAGPKKEQTTEEFIRDWFKDVPDPTKPKESKS